MKLTEKFRIGKFTVEYSNYMILITRKEELVREIDVGRDYDEKKYTEFIEEFTEMYNKKFNR